MKKRAERYVLMDAELENVSGQDGHTAPYISQRHAYQEKPIGYKVYRLVPLRSSKRRGRKKL